MITFLIFVGTWIGLGLLVGPALGSLSHTGDGDEIITPEDVMKTLDRLEREQAEARRGWER